MTAKAAAAGAMADEIADLIFLFSMMRFDEVHSKGNPASISSVEIKPCGIAQAFDRFACLVVGIR